MLGNWKLSSAVQASLVDVSGRMSNDWQSANRQLLFLFLMSHRVLYTLIIHSFR